MIQTYESAGTTSQIRVPQVVPRAVTRYLPGPEAPEGLSRVEPHNLADNRLLGQSLFTARFLVQWVVSEKKRASVVPVAFWWLSLLGGTALLAYAIFRRDPVIITGQGMGLFVYVRNLMLVGKSKAKRAQANHGLARKASRTLSPHAVAPNS